MLTTDIERKEDTTIVRCVGRIVVGDVPDVEVEESFKNATR